MDNFAEMVIEVLRDDEPLGYEFGIQDRVTFYNRANPSETSLGNSFVQMNFQDARTPQRLANTRHGRDRRRGRGAAQKRTGTARRRNRTATQTRLGDQQDQGQHFLRFRTMVGFPYGSGSTPFSQVGHGLFAESIPISNMCVALCKMG